jgi:hypothetical protein
VRNLWRTDELPKWSPHLRAKITRDFSASDRAHNEGSRDPVRGTHTPGGVLVLARNRMWCVCIGVEGETGAFKCLTLSTLSPARPGLFFETTCLSALVTDRAMEA